MKNFVVHLFSVLNLCVSNIEQVSGEGTTSDLWRLYEDLRIDSGEYHKEVRPVRNSSAPITIGVQLWFKQILKVDEVDQVLSVYCWLEEYWTDDHLQWDPKQYGGINLLHIPANVIWKPDILVYNSANMQATNGQHETNAVVNSSGHVILFRAVITDVTCALDMTYFPFDQQYCFVTLASWSFDGSTLALTAAQRTDALKFYVDNSEWTLLDFRFKTNLKYYECCPSPFADIVYFFSMQRNPDYYIVSLIIPSAFITVVTIIGFFIPHSSSGENTEKVSLGVTALLSLAIILLMVADKMPATAKVMPLIGKYYIGLIFLIFVATLTTTLPMSLQLRGHSGVRAPRRLRRFVFSTLAPLIHIRLNLPAELAQDCGVDPNDSNETTLLLQSQSKMYTEDRDVAQEETLVDLNPKPPANVARMRPISQQGQLMENTLEQISKSLSEFKERFEGKLREELVKKEWEQLSRVCERILMMIFIALTLIFAFVMLSTRGEPVILSDELMSKQS